MATTFHAPVARKLLIADEFGKVGEVIVAIEAAGVSLRGAGTRRRLFVPWQRLALAAQPPGEMAAWAAMNPIGWLIFRPGAKEETNNVGAIAQGG